MRDDRASVVRPAVDWRTFFGGLNSAAASRKAAPGVRPLVDAKHEIDRRFVEPVRLDDVAASAKLSKFHLVRAFRKIYQRTPHQYVIERRVRRARELLERTDMSVTAICFEVGFESLGSFVSMFRRIVGVPPGRYRRQFSRDAQDPVRAPVPACLYNAFRQRPR
jgi:AraC-like DNA-binding protein